MDVHVDEAGADDLARRVEHGRPLRDGELRPEPGDLAVLDEEILNGIDGVRGVEHMAATDHEAHAASALLLPARSSKTAMRTATPLAT